jgi:hypothetical protein
VTVTLAGMGERVRADHAAYIDAVLRCLQERDVSVTARASSGQGIRAALLHIRPDPEAFATAVPEEGFLAWDEENGWSLASRWDPGALAPRSPVYKGLGVLPDPEDVATWAVVLVTHPELTPDRQDHPLRDHAAEDPEFEAQLARYAPGR